MTTGASSTARRRLGVGAAVTLVIAALAVTVGIGILRGAGAPATALPLATATTAVEPADVFVHVAGAVAAPGLYRLDRGARVVDAVAAAGGFAADADRQGVNLARPVADGEQLVVPVVGAAPVAAAVDAGDGLVDINTADQATLETLPRIGPALAERIIAWREDNGGFTSVDDLLAVPGIGDAMLAALRDLVRV